MKNCEVMALGRAHWPELYRLMVARNFPDVPDRYDKAKPYFEKSSLYGLLHGSELAAGFVFGEAEEGIAFFDVICRANSQGMWATPGVLRELFRLAFEVLKLRCVWVQPKNKKALHAALQAGFVPATALDVKEPILAMTPRTMPRRLKSKQED